MVVPTMPPLKLYQGNYTLVSEYNMHVLYNPNVYLVHICLVKNDGCMVHRQCNFSIISFITGFSTVVLVL